MPSPAGIPSRITTSARPCDSPAVRKRSMRVTIVYEVSVALRPRRRVFRCDLARTLSVGRLHSPGAELSLQPPMLIADRFLANGASWIDLATGDAVRLRVATAGERVAPLRWSERR